MQNKEKALTVRMTEEQDTMIRTLAEDAGKSNAAVIGYALDIGLRQLAETEVRSDESIDERYARVMLELASSGRMATILRALDARLDELRAAEFANLAASTVMTRAALLALAGEDVGVAKMFTRLDTMQTFEMFTEFGFLSKGDDWKLAPSFCKSYRLGRMGEFDDREKVSKAMLSAMHRIDAMREEVSANVFEASPIAGSSPDDYRPGHAGSSAPEHPKAGAGRKKRDGEKKKGIGR